MILAAWYHTILAILFAAAAVLLMMVILLQRGKGVGLAGAFGGAGGNTAFGAKTGDVLTWVTIIGAIVVLAFAVVLNFVFESAGPGLGAGAPPTPAAGQTAPGEQPAESPPAGGGAALDPHHLAPTPVFTDVIFGDAEA